MDRKRFDRYILRAVYIVESEDHERNEIMFLIAADNCWSRKDGEQNHSMGSPMDGTPHSPKTW